MKIRSKLKVNWPYFLKSKYGFWICLKLKEDDWVDIGTDRDIYFAYDKMLTGYSSISPTDKLIHKTSY